MSEVGNLKLRKTWDIIEAAEKGMLPDKIMINMHPQRWDDRFGPWLSELIIQNIKNVLKRIIVRRLRRLSVSRPSTIFRTYGVNKGAKPQRRQG